MFSYGGQHICIPKLMSKHDMWCDNKVLSWRTSEASLARYVGFPIFVENVYPMQYVNKTSIHSWMGACKYMYEHTEVNYFWSTVLMRALPYLKFSLLLITEENRTGISTVIKTAMQAIKLQYKHVKNGNHLICKNSYPKKKKIKSDYPKYNCGGKQEHQHCILQGLTIVRRGFKTWEQSHSRF